MLQTFDQRRIKYAEALRGIVVSTLDFNDQEELRVLHQQVDAQNSLDDPLEKLTALSELFDRCKHFMGRLQREEHSAKEKLDRLKKRFQQFKRSNFAPFFLPEWSRRIGGLIEGAELHAPQWEAMKNQITEAGHLLQQVEIQVQRLTAQRIAESAAMLAQHPSSKNDKLLSRLSAYSDSLPPNNIRFDLDRISEPFRRVNG